MSEPINSEVPADGLGINRIGNVLLCCAWGEQDCPNISVVRNVGELKQFIVREWIADPQDPLIDSTLQMVAQKDWREDGVLSWEFEIGGCSIKDVVLNPPLLDVIPLATRWRKEADQYQRQVDEARSKNLPHDQMLSMVTSLRACAAELEQAVKKNSER